MKPALTPYLMFMGKTREAMTFYQSVLGGELTMQSFAESGMPTTDENKDYIIHANLANDFLTIMASDGDAQHPVKMGDNIHMSISGSDDEQLRKYFDGLAQGGHVDMELQKQFWGDIYGQLTDKFGVHWMVNISSDKPQK